MCSAFSCLISMINQWIDSLSIKCSLLSRSSRASVINISKSIVILNRHVPTHRTYWWDVWKIGTSSTITTWVVHFRSDLAMVISLNFFVCIKNKQLFSCRSNHGRTMLLDQSSLINIEARDPSRFYNDNTSSLSNKVSQLTMWSYSRKHTFEMARLFCRPLRMHM